MSEVNLAEGRWFWRRLYVFGTSVGLWLLLAWVVVRCPPSVLPRVAEGLMGLLALMLVLYLVAPTAQQIVSVVADLKMRLISGRAER